MARFHWFLLAFIPSTIAKCFEPSPAFPVPEWNKDFQKALQPAFPIIEKQLRTILADSKYDTSAVSIGLTSSTETLWSTFHTARKLNLTRPGTTKVDANSLYRIASITKTFTTLAILQQHNAGNLSLDDPVNKYLPQLNGTLPWKDITLRTLASQLSGLPRELFQGDLINNPSAAKKFNLPDVSREDLPTCDEYADYKPCTPKDLYKHLATAQPVFAPQQRSTYSNIAYDILGLVIEKVSGNTYEEYLRANVFAPAGMTSASVTKPSDDNAVLPANIEGQYWDVDEGVQAPTGGIYASEADLSSYLRFVLTSYNALATGVNWFLPASWSGGMGSFYGMPWEIFRTDGILREMKRPVTFVTKGGSLPGYYSKIYLLEEYGLGVTILVGGESGLLGVLEEAVLPALVRSAEEVVWKGLARTHAGVFAAVDSKINSSAVLAVSAKKGLEVKSFVLNGTDVLQAAYGDVLCASSRSERKWHAQLTPTLLFKNETTQEGEIWYVMLVPERSSGTSGIFEEFCTGDIDPLFYAGQPLTQVVFWHREHELEFPAWRLSLRLTAQDDNRDALVVQS